MHKNLKMPDKVFAVFLILLVLFNLNAAYFISSNRDAYEEHSSGIVLIGRHMHKTISQASGPMAIEAVFRMCTLFPPLHTLLTGYALALLGESLDSVLYLNLLFLDIMLVSIYYLGTRLLDRYGGIIGVAVAISSPKLLQFTFERYYAELALGAFVAASMALLASTDLFRKKGYAAALGVALAACAYIKYNFFIFMGGMIYYIWDTKLATYLTEKADRVRSSIIAWKHDRARAELFLIRFVTSVVFSVSLCLLEGLFLLQIPSLVLPPLYLFLGFLSLFMAGIVLYLSFREGTRQANLILAIAICYVLSFIWYFPALPGIVEHVLYDPYMNITTMYSGPSDPFSIFNLLAYGMVLINTDYTLFIAVLLIISLFLGFFRIWSGRSDHFERHSFLVLALWFLVSYMSLTALKTKMYSYAIPYIPAVALLVAYLIVSVRIRAVKFLLICMISLFAIISNMNYMTGLENGPTIDLRSRLNYSYRNTDYFNELRLLNIYTPHYSTDTEPTVESIINRKIYADERGGSDPPRVFVLLVYGSATSLTLTVNDLFEEDAGIEYLQPDFGMSNEMLEGRIDIREFDYVILKEGRFHPEEKDMLMDKVHDKLLRDGLVDVAAPMTDLMSSDMKDGIRLYRVKKEDRKAR